MNLSERIEKGMAVEPIGMDGKDTHVWLEETPEQFQRMCRVLSRQKQKRSYSAGHYKNNPDYLFSRDDHRYHRIQELAQKGTSRTPEDRTEVISHLREHFRAVLPDLPRSLKESELSSFQSYHGYDTATSPDQQLCQDVEKNPSKYQIDVAPGMDWDRFTQMTGCADPLEWRRRMVGMHPLIDHQKSSMELLLESEHPEDDPDQPPYTSSLTTYLHLRDAQNRHLAIMERSITTAEGEETSATNHRLEVEEPYQGLGLAESIYQSQEEAFRAAGVEHIQTLANISVGGYAWAKQGFDFAEAQSHQEVHQAVKNHLVDIGKPLSEAMNLTQDLHHSWDFATLHVDGRHVGKEAMIGSGWYAQKQLQDGWPGNVIANLSRSRLFGIDIKEGK